MDDTSLFCRTILETRKTDTRMGVQLSGTVWTSPKSTAGHPGALEAGQSGDLKGTHPRLRPGRAAHG